ncbi:MAG: DNA alkylation repair protein [Christensenellaceae bacterium]|nr:DNA alkylation repair protein [Christensenellaceae bacterium]
MAIRQELLSMQDLAYRDFSAKLIPTVDKENIIGVRSPKLKAYAKTLVKNKALTETFINTLPHKYLEEYSLHNILLSYEKDIDKLFGYIDALLPFIDNWATCDGLCSSLKQLKKHPAKTLSYINKCLNSNKTYTVRFATVMLLSQFLDDAFDVEHIERLAEIKSEEYYINIAIAWYMATALAKQYNHAVKYIENRAFSPWVHNKSIQKAIESYRVSDEAKAYLKSLKQE